MCVKYATYVVEIRRHKYEFHAYFWTTFHFDIEVSIFSDIQMVPQFELDQFEWHLNICAQCMLSQLIWKMSGTKIQWKQVNTGKSTPQLCDCVRNCHFQIVDHFKWMAFFCVNLPFWHPQWRLSLIERFPNSHHFEWMLSKCNHFWSSRNYINYFRLDVPIKSICCTFDNSENCLGMWNKKFLYQNEPLFQHIRSFNYISQDTMWWTRRIQLMFHYSSFHLLANRIWQSVETTKAF